MREMLRNLSGLADLVLWRDGGQRGSRRNAWRSMVEDHRRVQDRAEAEAAVPTAPAYAATSAPG